jgi:hypothetical protein
MNYHGLHKRWDWAANSKTGLQGARNAVQGKSVVITGGGVEAVAAHPKGSRL